MVYFRLKNFAFYSSQLMLGTVLVLSTTAAHGASYREALIDILIETLQARQALFKGTPITHIVPEFNTVTYAVDCGLLNTAVVPEYRSVSSSKEKLTYSGWKASPYLALSLKKIGIGFNVEAGKKNLDYENNWGDTKRTQRSTVDYRGLGIYLFYKPFDWKDVIPSFSIGGKSLNAVHEYDGLMSEAERESSTIKSAKVNYSVFDYSVGLNTQLKMVKPVTVIPWVDYVSVDDAAAHSAYSRNINWWSSTTFDEDLKVMWNDRPTLNYGIDFGLETSGLEVRFGGILGGLLGMGMAPDNVRDQGLRITFAWNQKG